MDIKYCSVEFMQSIVCDYPRRNGIAFRFVLCMFACLALTVSRYLLVRFFNILTLG